MLCCFKLEKLLDMRFSTIVYLGLAAFAVAVAVQYNNNQRKKRCGNILTEISDQGYETAHDILYPRSQGGSKLHYGPVIPNN